MPGIAKTTLRSMAALLAALALVLPCPCEDHCDDHGGDAVALAEAPTESHSCCPGTEEVEAEADGDDETPQSPCAHCGDDTYVQADGPELPAAWVTNPVSHFPAPPVAGLAAHGWHNLPRLLPQLYDLPPPPLIAHGPVLAPHIPSTIIRC